MLCEILSVGIYVMLLVLLYLFDERSEYLGFIESLFLIDREVELIVFRNLLDFSLFDMWYILVVI